MNWLIYDPIAGKILARGTSAIASDADLNLSNWPGMAILKLPQTHPAWQDPFSGWTVNVSGQLVSPLGIVVPTS
jgi:hypothetical protein